MHLIATETLTAAELAAHINTLRRPAAEILGARYLIAFRDSCETRTLESPASDSDAATVDAFCESVREEIDLYAARLAWCERYNDSDGSTVRIGRSARRCDNVWQVQTFVIE